jgi:hypothetical protein
MLPFVKGHSKGEDSLQQERRTTRPEVSVSPHLRLDIHKHPGYRDGAMIVRIIKAVQSALIASGLGISLL